MAEYLIKDTTLTEIANAIRNKAEKTDKIPVSRFAKEINELKAGGNPPTLDETLPADASYVTGGSVVCNVLILGDYDPADYSYQWYVDNTAVIGATSSSYTVNTTTVGTLTVYCNVTNQSGTISSRVATIRVKSTMPEYTYDGTAVLTDEGNNNWNIQFKTGGDLKFTELGNAGNGIQVFLCGGGGTGGSGGGYGGGGGGGGGYTTTGDFTPVANSSYTITIGGGGGATSGFGLTANPGTSGSGGSNGDYSYSASGGAGTGKGGGGGMGRGGIQGNGYNGGAGAYAFGVSGGTQYGGGGGGGGCATSSNEGESGGSGGATGGGKGGTGGAYSEAPSAGVANTGGGGGGGGGYYRGGAPGGSGIVIIRNKRS